MKRVIILLLLAVPFLSGCTKIDTNLTINKDKSAQIEAKLVYDGNIADRSDVRALAITNNYEKFLDEDYKVEKDYNSKESTITATKKVKNLKNQDLNLSSLGFVTNSYDDRFISVKKNFFITLYNIDMTYSVPRVLEGLKRSANQEVKSVLNPEYFQKYGDKDDLAGTEQGRADFLANFDLSTIKIAQDDVKQEKEKQEKIKNTIDNSFDLKDLTTTFTVKLPMFASFNNADVSNGTSYIWYLRRDTPTLIKLQYVVYSSFSIVLLFLFGLGILIYMARRILRHDGQKRVGK